MSRTALVAFVFAVAGCDLEGHLETPEWSLERMIEQPRADAYERSPVFPDETWMRPLPAGVVHSKAIVGRPEVTEGRTSDGAFVTEFPIRIGMPLLHEGQRRFQILCATCHGELGDGSSAVAPYMELRKPVSFHTEYHRAFPPGRIFATITHGVGLMPSYAAELDVTQRWAVVAYVRALQLSRYAPVTELPAEVHRELQRQVQ